MIGKTAAAILSCFLGHQTLVLDGLGNGKTDAGPALQRALDAAKPGDVLIIPPGRYLVGEALVLRQDNVSLAGNHATLVATDPARQTLQIAGAHDVLFGVDFVGAGTTRLGSNSSTKIEVTGSYDLIAGNHIKGGASAGIFVYGGSYFAILGNSVTATLADGIHMANGAHDGVVAGNQVSANGDDMIAVVSYAAQKTVDSDILIEHNQLSANYWGRGISVVGGRNVTIRDNQISDVKQSAAIYLAEEEGRYHTASVSNIIITGNHIKNDQTAGNYIAAAKHPAIYLFTWQGSVQDVLLRDNAVDGAGYGGFSANGNICNIAGQGNTFANIQAPQLTLDFRDCALNIFKHCSTRNLGGIRKCANGDATVSGSHYTGGELWNCNAGLLQG
jgi:hypothetical protein